MCLSGASEGLVKDITCALTKFQGAFDGFEACRAFWQHFRRKQAAVRVVDSSLGTVLARTPGVC